MQFEKDFIHQLLSEDIMQESVIYQDILQKGERIGEQKGEQKRAKVSEQKLVNKKFEEQSHKARGHNWKTSGDDPPFGIPSTYRFRI